MVVPVVNGVEDGSAPQQDGHHLKLVGFSNFKRNNPFSDKFDVKRFHHIEFWTTDATNAYRRFSWGLGMQHIASSDIVSGNTKCSSHAIKSNDLIFAFTAPYHPSVDSGRPEMCGWPGYEQQKAMDFVGKHGLAVRAVAISVADAFAAHAASVEHGAISVLEPQKLVDEATGTSMEMAEVHLYGDVVVRYVSFNGEFSGPFLPNFAAVNSPPLSYGLTRLDHAVGNVPKLIPAAEYLSKFTGFHEFAEFIAEDVGTVDSGLNSMVLASNNEMVLFPINEPTFGTKRKSQIQTYLEHNVGPGLQHLALMCTDILTTLREMRQRTHCGGFDFMPRPSDAYYRKLPERVGEDTFTPEQLKQIEELGILVDRDDQGILLQIFTKPLGDRPTVFIEIIQRVGCEEKDECGRVYQKGGCGGFGKGNFSELFKSIEDFERTFQE
eukprot:jgi/Chlat1/701/Chrsp104S01202